MTPKYFKTVHDFCSAFFHTEKCFEWDNSPICMKRCGDKKECMRRSVVIVVRLIKGDETYFEKKYENEFHGHTHTNIHAEAFIVKDVYLKDKMKQHPKSTLELFTTFQPCNHSGGGRGAYKKRNRVDHNTSCVSKLVQFSEKLEKYDINMVIKCAGIYRAHWTDNDKFDSSKDVEIYGRRTAAARKGIVILKNISRIKLRGLVDDDWVYLKTLCDPEVTSAMKPHIERRKEFDEKVDKFLINL
jgi:hypothetical protein